MAYVAYLRSKGLRDTSLKADFSRISSLFDCLVESGQLRANPVPLSERSIRSYKDEVRGCRIITFEEAAKMVAATSIPSLMLLLLKKGIRRHEPVTLDVSDLDLDNQTTVHETDSEEV